MDRQCPGSIFVEQIYGDAGALYLRLWTDGRLDEMYHWICSCKERCLDSKSCQTKIGIIIIMY